MKTKILSILALLLMTVTQGAWAQETLTVFDGTADNRYSPMNSYIFDNYTKCECIIPASELTAMEGGTITAITFYARAVATQNAAWTNTNQKVFLKEVSGTTLSSYSGMTGATVVFDGTLPMPTTSASGYTITFSQGYTYNGGNLLIGVYNDAKGKYNQVRWYGIDNQSSGVSAYGYSTLSPAEVGFTKQTFLPKTTFTYTPAPFSGGSGTQASPYLIASTTDWNNLVSAVNGGETYSGKYFKMTANVSTVSTWMTGTFSGTFDGYGNTLTVGYSTSARYCAPFGTLGGTVKNLRVAGTLSTSGKNFGGIAAQVTSGKTATIQNCHVSTSFTSTLSGDNSSSSFVGVVWSGGTLNITGCAFTGSLTGSGNAFGGFLGYKEGTCSMTDCLFAPASVTVSTDYAGTFSRPSAPTMTRCYYTQKFNEAQGMQARTIVKGDGVSTLSVTKGSGTTYNVAGITVYSNGVDYNSNFYCGSGQTVSLALTAETRSGYQFTQYAASQGTLSAQTATSATLTMPAANSTANDAVTVTAQYSVPAATAVDLGLPSGMKWADRNVGAGSETGYGTYYAWSSSDIATAQWGVNWRMPTLTEAQELINNTDHEWATIGGINGMKYMKKTDHSVYIFVPAAGWNANTNVGTKGTYWTSTTLEADDNKAYELFLDASNTTTGNDRKTYQFTVRPVQMSPQGSWNYDYTGAVQSFTAPYEGTYTLEAWGAQGGNWVKTDRSPGVGGRGGYASGTVTLAKNQTIYIYVGGQGATTENQQSGGAGGWNGGGTGGNSVSSQGNYVGAGGGGGASHVSLSNAQVIGTDVTTLSGTNYLIVAGGGGGAVTWTATAGAGGGTEGGTGATTGGTSLSPWYNSTLSTGCNGYNAVDYSSFSAEGTGGGGGGYLGGNAGTVTSGTSNQDCGGCGGSSNYNSTYVSNFTTTSDVREGAGKVTITFLSGEGTEASPYLIASTTDWNNLVSAVNAGEAYSGNYFKMTANVGTVTTWMTGTFSGTFDGDGKTLTVDYDASTEGCAPFGTLSGATIQNLKVAGSISSNQRLVAGIAALCSSTGNSVTNCLVSATINSSYSGNAADGGLVSLVDDGASLNVTGCAFAGKLLTTNGTTSCGGIVGWRRSSGTVTITNCLYAPTSATGSETWIGSAEGENGNANFCRWNSSEPTITNCYYTTDFGSGSYTAQGLQARSISAGDYVTVANAGAATVYNVSGITSYGTGIQYGGVLYGGNEDAVSLTLTAPEHDGYGFVYSADNGTVTGNSNPYTLTMVDANAIINVKYSASKAINKYTSDETSDGWYLIASPLDGEVEVDEVEHLQDNVYDLYYFDQSREKEWVNYKEHEGNANPGFDLVSGKGYLYANSGDVTLTFIGTPYSGNGEVSLAYSVDNPDVNMRGWNLVGNPFATTATLNKPFYKMNNDGNGLTAKIEDLNTTIAAMEGVFVQATAEGQSATFTAQTSKGGQQAIAKTNIVLSGNKGKVLDNAIIRFDNGETLGKFYFGEQNANLYIPQDAEEYAIATSNGQGEMPLNFKANANGEYTLTVNPENVEMGYLHLIDNMTGADIDLLQTPEYSFSAKATDYESRFRLVFVCGDANDDNGDNETFAFFSNGSWVIANEGEATLQVIDLNGRILSSETVNGSVSKSINQPAGVYMIRLINGENVKVQKVVIE